MLFLYDDSYKSHYGAYLESAAGKGGRLAMLEWLIEHRMSSVQSMADAAASHGHIELVKFAFEKDATLSSYSVVYNAVIVGQLHVLQFLHEERKISLDAYLALAAAQSGNSPTFAYVMQNAAYRLPDLLYFGLLTNIANGGSIECMRHVEQMKPLIPQSEFVRMLSEAVTSSKADMVRYIVENFITSEPKTLAQITVGQSEGATDLSIVKYLHERGFRFDAVGLVKTAVSSDQVETMRYFRALIRDHPHFPQVHVCVRHARRQ